MEDNIRFEIETLNEINNKLDFIINNATREHMDTIQAAKYLNVHPNTIRKYTDAGLIKVSYFGSKRIYKKEWLDDFVENGGQR